jgi:hypothetical protein
MVITAERWILIAEIHIILIFKLTYSGPPKHSHVRVD